MASAASRGDVVYTSDFNDLAVLTTCFPNVRCSGSEVGPHHRPLTMPWNVGGASAVPSTRSVVQLDVVAALVTGKVELVATFSARVHAGADIRAAPGSVSWRRIPRLRQP